jgi:hypothetical protein
MLNFGGRVSEFCERTSSSLEILTTKVSARRFRALIIYIDSSVCTCTIGSQNALNPKQKRLLATKPPEIVPIVDTFTHVHLGVANIRTTNLDRASILFTGQNPLMLWKQRKCRSSLTSAGSSENDVMCMNHSTHG